MILYLFRLSKEVLVVPYSLATSHPKHRCHQAVGMQEGRLWAEWQIIPEPQQQELWVSIAC